MNPWLMIYSLIFTSITGTALVGKEVAWAAGPLENITHIEQLREQADKAYQRGQFPEAIGRWQQALDLYSLEGPQSEKIDLLISISEAALAQGKQRAALQALLQARGLAEGGNDKTGLSAVLAVLGKYHLLTAALDEARLELQTSLDLAREAGNPALQAAALNDLGTVFEARKQRSLAQAAYAQGLEIAERIQNSALMAKLLTNLGRTMLDEQSYDAAGRYLLKGLDSSRGLPDSHEKAYGFVSLAEMLKELSLGDHARRSRWVLHAHEAFTEALSVSKKLTHRRAASYALGNLAGLYGQRHRQNEAVILLRRAIYSAQQVGAAELLYLWQWRLARLLASRGEMDAAISLYRQSAHNLQSIRHGLAAKSTAHAAPFRKQVEPVYFELADLLLRRSDSIKVSEQVQSYYLEARQTMEQLKAAELENYFQDQCVAALQSRITPLDRLAPYTAAVYPILFSDRVELLLSMSDGIRRFTVGVDREALTREVRAFRRMLEKRTTREYLPHARRLHDWLIRPLIPELERNRVSTLVFVPDGPLRTIPMASLHDGEDFLVKRFALASTPGLSLTDHRPIERKNVQVLANGLTEAVQGFSPLAHVSIEMDSIQALYGGTFLMNEEFLISNVKTELSKAPYSIVHVATHGQFASEADHTFLLAFDAKLTMDKLERFMGLSNYREKPVELLTLSACQSAAGDDRAALGLAGIAVKAGARSALATLWFINDKASSLLIAEFYRQLKNPLISKAEALRRAQLELIAERRYRHPGYWAPFLLIGNWL
jgi:CHAT domain-containing protein